ncbi:MAG: T9SS type A sorting domain-containing protein [Chitinophagales bacterium]
MKFSSFFLTACVSIVVSAQVPSGGGLIINEINQGTASGTKEFYELLVIGDPASPCAPVDLTGWVFDDNNGDFEICGSGVGIQAGHYRFTSCYNAVPPGSLLVIYNVSDPYIGMPADDPNDADGNFVYIIPSNSSCLESNYTTPNATTPNCLYSGSYSSPTTSWAAGMANTGDAVQVRKPDYSFYHGYSFGNVNTTYPAWPSGASSGTSFNKGSGNLAFGCGDFWNSANFFTTTAAAGTPGTANSAANGYFIGEILNCDLVYTDLDDIINCDLVLPVTLTYFIATAAQNSVQLNWETLSEIDCKDYVIERSATLHQFSAIGNVNCIGSETTSAQYVFTDDAPMSGINYYRLKQVDASGKFTYSNIETAFINNTSQLFIYPNPASSTLHISQAEVDALLLITDVQGRVIEQLDFSETINISNLPPGIYSLKLISGNTMSCASFIKE